MEFRAMVVNEILQKGTTEKEDRGSSIQLEVTLKFREWVNKENLIYMEIS